MEAIEAKSKNAAAALKLVRDLQTRLVKRMGACAPTEAAGAFAPVTWLRSGGTFGGGTRFVATSDAFFNRTSVNVSQVQYESDPSKALGSATALSTILHPQNPHAPSLHMHISFTEVKSGKAYWRIMADLNPSIPHDEGTQKFENALRAAGGEHFAHGKAQGEKYFYIPALGRHRGVSHFYLEEFDSGDFERDCAFARAFGERICDTYGEIVTESIAAFPAPSEEDKKKQLAYHTLYFFQVLTLDRGTTSGLLVHSDNDVGILGSLPAQIDRSLLESWRDKVPAEQKALVQTLLDALPAQTPCTVDEAVKAKLASDIRTFYQRHPEAQEFLARGDVVAPTTANHR